MASGMRPNVRPTSFYDNIELDNGEDQGMRGAIPLVRLPLDTSIPITFSDRTTVPLNLVLQPNRNPGERHTPTRSSLRHSRMIVNRTREVDNGSPPLIINGPVMRNDLRQLFVVFDILKIFDGILIVLIALWIILWIPDLTWLQEPYWAGIPLILSGFYGFVVSCCFQGNGAISTKCFSTKIVEICGITISVICIIVCFMGFVFISLHFWLVPDVACTSTEEECLCHNAAYDLPGTSTLYKFEPVLSFTCLQAKELLIVLLIVEDCACILGFIISFMYAYFYVSHFKYNIYRKIRLEGQEAY